MMIGREHREGRRELVQYDVQPSLINWKKGTWHRCDYTAMGRSGLPAKTDPLPSLVYWVMV
jgi:hypothetical protein